VLRRSFERSQDLFPFLLHAHRLIANAPSWEDRRVAEEKSTLLIKRYASRRLYNTETSDYVTLEDIASFIREGREVQIVDLKSGDDLTRQYLLQIIADHESRGESVLPVGVLNDLVRSYTTQTASVVPQFLQMSFDMLRDGQSKVVDSMSTINPTAKMPGFEAMQAQQEAFMKAMTSGMTGFAAPPAAKDEAPAPKGDDLSDIKKQLAELQDKLSKLS
jgi:polyhydroxyalkanoate synthesis repressor PhaR